ncbi:hypothetical protein [Pectobacterium aroidearum]|uniref:hypothetical protein n=1 Tax=Pectobacterium aroidearum TaxID=1201031 RepID=UPI0032EADCF5
MKKLPGSLEIKLHEKLSKNDILNVLAEQMTMLEDTSPSVSIVDTLSQMLMTRWGQSVKRIAPERKSASPAKLLPP